MTPAIAFALSVALLMGYVVGFHAGHSSARKSRAKIPPPRHPKPKTRSGKIRGGDITITRSQLN